mgnify:CR=1 FL=1
MLVNTTITEAIQKHGTTKEKLIPVMQYIVTKDKWLREDAMEDVARAFGISAAEVYGVASFYSFLDTEPRGKYVIRICRTISCDMAGKEEIINSISGILKVKAGQTSPDGLFTLLETNCMGWCHVGPAMLINDDVYTELTADKAVKIIQEYMDKK